MRIVRDCCERGEKGSSRREHGVERRALSQHRVQKQPHDEQQVVERAGVGKQRLCDGGHIAIEIQGRILGVWNGVGARENGMRGEEGFEREFSGCVEAGEEGGDKAGGEGRRGGGGGAVRRQRRKGV